MKVAIHQPNYFPWLGYFVKIALCDVFVFHDNVDINLRSYTRRCTVSTQPNAKEKQQHLSLQIKDGDSQNIKDVQLINPEADIKLHLSKIRAVYHKEKYFEEVFDQLVADSESWEKHGALADLNISVIQTICKIISLELNAVKSSTLAAKAIKDEHNIALVKWQNGDVYLSGMGAKKYQNEDLFLNENIELVYLDSLQWMKDEQGLKNLHVEYSILELLFKLGPKQISQVLKHFKLRLDK